MRALWLLWAAIGLGHPPPEKGVALGLFSADPKYSYRPLLEEIRDLGATHVLLSWVWWQADLRAVSIEPIETWSPTDAQIRGSIEAAKSLGLHVTCLPIVRLVKSSKTEWRGRISPDDESRWWSSYRDFILHAAEIADRAGADRFSVGSELVSRESDRHHWAEIIDEIRAERPRLELMYSANWDHHREVSFWDLVDVVGITGYFELTKRYDASVEDLALAWMRIQRPLEEWSRGVGKRIVLSEIGYPSLDGGAAWPWDETRSAPVDLEEQRRAYEAAARSWSDVAFLQGLYWWNWFGEGGPADTNYTPRKKPAAEVIRAWYLPKREPPP